MAALSVATAKAYSAGDGAVWVQTNFNGYRLSVPISSGMTQHQIQSAVQTAFALRSLAVPSLTDTRLMGENGKKTAAHLAAVNAPNMHYSTKAFVTINGKMVGIPLQVDASTTVEGTASPTMTQQFMDVFAQAINARQDMTGDQKAEAIKNFKEDQASQLIQTHLEVNFEGAVFIHSQLGADPNGEIRLSSLTELTGTFEQAPGQKLFQVQQLVNEIRKQHPDMKMKDLLNHCPIEWEGQQYPSLRAFLGLMADAGLQIEGYDQVGNRYPASILMEMTGTQLGLSGLAFKIYDPNPTDQEYIDHLNPHNPAFVQWNRLHNPGTFGLSVYQGIPANAQMTFIGKETIIRGVNGNPLVMKSIGQADGTGKQYCMFCSTFTSLYIDIISGIDRSNIIQQLQTNMPGINVDNLIRNDPDALFKLIYTRAEADNAWKEIVIEQILSAYYQDMRFAKISESASIQVRKVIALNILCPNGVGADNRRPLMVQLYGDYRGAHSSDWHNVVVVDYNPATNQFKIMDPDAPSSPPIMGTGGSHVDQGQFVFIDADYLLENINIHMDMDPMTGEVFGEIRYVD